MTLLEIIRNVHLGKCISVAKYNVVVFVNIIELKIIELKKNSDQCYKSKAIDFVPKKTER